jgi:hypothetical protein
MITQGEEIILLLKMESFLLSHKVQQTIRNRNHMTLTPLLSLIKRKFSLEILHTLWHIFLFQDVPEHCPHEYNNGTLEHQVVYTLFTLTKLTEFTAFPLLSSQIICSLNSISLYQPHKIFDVQRQLGVPQLFHHHVYHSGKRHVPV